MRLRERLSFDEALDGAAGPLICDACGDRCDELYPVLGVQVCGESCADDVTRDVWIDERIDDDREVA